MAEISRCSPRATGAGRGADRPRGPQRRAGAAGTDHRQDERAGRADASSTPCTAPLAPVCASTWSSGGPAASDRASPACPRTSGSSASSTASWSTAGSSTSRTAGAPEVFLGSADWMPRNFFRRIEVMFPVEDPRLKARLIDELLPVVLNDNVKARQLQADGTYTRVTRADGQDVLRSQAVFQSLARESAREAADSALRFVPIFGPAGAPPADEPASSNGASTGQRSKPPRVRSPRARKRPEPA